MLFLKDDGDWNDHREVFGRPVIVVAHREDGPLSVTHHHDLGRVVVEIPFGPGDIESTKSFCFASLEHER